MKFLLFDLDAATPFQNQDPKTRQKIKDLYSRFYGAFEFLKKTTTVRGGKQIPLNDLPWYLLIGPQGAGKTSLLVNSNVNYLLQKQLEHFDAPHLKTSEVCDWWITRDTGIIDVPGNYLFAQSSTSNLSSKPRFYPLLWQLFLHLIRKKRGKNGLHGVIIAIPFPQIMKEADSKNYQTLLRYLLKRCFELQQIFPQPIRCHLLVTKCDLLPGFSEFFAEYASDEIAQAWGVPLHAKPGEKMQQIFSEQFNALIKKLNQQLLWRLHHERNPLLRPYIKDFPLQVEQLKEYLQDFIKKISTAPFNLSLEGVYLTSALQHAPKQNPVLACESTDTTHREIQLFKKPSPITRAYFIKQFIAQALLIEKPTVIAAPPMNIWLRFSAYALSIAMIGLASGMLGKDFEQGIKRSYSVQNYLTDYQLTVQQTQDPDIHLQKVTALLDTLQASAAYSPYKLDLHTILTFYTHKAQQKTGVVYYHVLKTILLPEVKNYFEEYLKNAVNNDTDSVYAVLKAYLMLDNASYLQTEYIINTLKNITPASVDKTHFPHLTKHLRFLLNHHFNPSELNAELTERTRYYFTSMPSFQLSYIILKNMNNNNVLREINLGLNNEKLPVLINKQTGNKMPLMFTANTFSTILYQQSMLAAHEAYAGNWILGENLNPHQGKDFAESLSQQLRTAYINHYIDVWESVLTNIHIASAQNLTEIDSMIVKLARSDSPLLQLLQTLHENTYFEPISSASPKLQSLSVLMDKNSESSRLLYQIFTSLESLHRYIQTIITANNERKAAFDAVSQHMLSHGAPDGIMQLRLTAANSPEPLRQWLETIANQTWHFLMQDASHYLDTSWRKEVIQTYQTEIADRYPFSTDSTQEVDLKNFTDFFGNPGTIMNFYNHYLQPLIDTTTPDWRWKMADNNNALPFSQKTLRQIKLATQIHHAFFPQGDNKLHVQFTLQPYKFGKLIKSIKLNINANQIIDMQKSPLNPHTIAWPNTAGVKKTSFQVMTNAQKIISKDYPGEWGWFKLVNQSFESVINKKKLLLDLSLNEYSAKYLLISEEQYNPFLSLNLRHFSLPQKLSEQKTYL